MEVLPGGVPEDAMLQLEKKNLLDESQGKVAMARTCCQSGKALHRMMEAPQ